MRIHWFLLILLVLTLFSQNLLAKQDVTQQSLEKCWLKKLNAAQTDPELEAMTVAELKALCLNELAVAGQNTDLKSSETSDEQYALDKRFELESDSQHNPFSILAHKPNYFLPVTYMTNPNHEVYQGIGLGNYQLDNLEAKFQLSFKVPVFNNSLFKNGDGLFFGMTMKSWWQVYNSEVSSPFRETNYQPEIFYYFPWNQKAFGGKFDWVVGIEHESNGRTQPLSRSWNRVYTALLFQGDRWALSLRPWYRLPERQKTDPLEPDGDDNPDIEDYLGRFEFIGAYQWNDNEFRFLLRNNLKKDNRGAIELGWSFPLFGKTKGVVEYFNGYGESLIDYNHSQQRIGVGFLLSEIL